MTDASQDLDYYLAVPYVLAMESVEHSDGEWYRRAEYPELPNCSAEAYSAVEAIEKLEEERVRCIRDLLERGEAVPVPRPPLRSTGEPLNPERLGFARWLVEEGRISDSR
jgi:predicted RNase H-like HicB family nuclease